MDIDQETFPPQLAPEVIDEHRRQFLVWLTSVMGGVGLIYACVPFVASWSPSAKAEAEGGPVEVDLSNLQPGEQITVEWRGQPVWIIRRSSEDVERLKKVENRLQDPHSTIDELPDYIKKEYRSVNKHYLILIGICTHLGCSPVYRPYLTELGDDWPGGFFCPCHGSMFDLAGRVFKGVPAPINLQIPPHKFISDTKVIIGVEDKPGN